MSQSAEVTHDEIRDLCNEVWSCIDSELTALVEVKNADDLHFDIEVLKKLQSRLEKFERDLIGLEKSISGCGIEPYDVVGDR